MLKTNSGPSRTIEGYGTVKAPRLNVRFDVNDQLYASVGSDSVHHLCIKLHDHKTGERIASYAIDQVDHADYMPEYRDQNLVTDFGVTFEQAVKMATERR